MTPFSSFWRLEFSAGGGPVTRGFSQRLGAVLAFVGHRLDLTPNLLTTFGLACYLCAAAAYAFLPSGLFAILICLILYQLGLGLDCSDGQLARATSRTSEFGAWWDVSADIITGLTLAFALVYWLSGQGDELTAFVMMAVLLLAIGKTLALYSSKAAAASSLTMGAGSQGASLRQPGKWLLLVVIDTPTLFLIVCLLRDATFLLCLYIAFMGALYCLNAAYLGLTKLQRS